MNPGQTFVLMIILMSTAGWVITTWIRAHHGYPLADDAGKLKGRNNPDAERKIGLLSSENERLTGQIGRLEERIAVLERIVTDSSHSLDREIEQLRSKTN